MKSSVVDRGDRPRRASGLRYFHNAGLLRARGEDYAASSGSTDLPGDVLPPYTELVRFDAGERLDGDELREAARERLREHLARRPATTRSQRFGAQLARRLPRLLEETHEDYHAYAFATVRMAGSALRALRGARRLAARRGRAARRSPR